MEEFENILTGCRRHDRKSQEELYRKLYPALFALCRSFFKDEHMALTALNNGMLSVFRNIGQHDPSRGKFFNWAYTVVRNAALTIIRETPPEMLTALDEAREDPNVADPFRRLEWKDIYVYLDALPDATRVACNLYYLQGYSLREIAAATGTKDGTVKWHLSEARHKLKAIISQQAKTSDA